MQLNRNIILSTTVLNVMDAHVTYITIKVAVRFGQISVILIKPFICLNHTYLRINPDSKVYGTNMGPTRVLSVPDGPHVGPINLTIREAHD